jgi:hypothetical protein
MEQLHPVVISWMTISTLSGIAINLPASLGRRNAERSADGNAARYSKALERLQSGCVWIVRSF